MCTYLHTHLCSVVYIVDSMFSTSAFGANVVTTNNGPVLLLLDVLRMPCFHYVILPTPKTARAKQSNVDRHWYKGLV